MTPLSGRIITRNERGAKVLVDADERFVLCTVSAFGVFVKYAELREMSR